MSASHKFVSRCVRTIMFMTTVGLLTLSLPGGVAADNEQPPETGGQAVKGTGTPNEVLLTPQVVNGATAAQYWYSVPPSAFIASNSSTTWNSGADWCLYTDYTAASFRAPVFLPHGSKIIKIEMDYLNPPNRYKSTSMQLVRHQWNGVVIQIASITGSELGSGPQFVQSQVLTETVYNWSNQYILNWSIPDFGSNQRLCGAHILFEPPAWYAAALPLVMRR